MYGVRCYCTGADIVENDGVYSRFFSQLRDPGVYTVRLDVTGHVNHGHVNHGHTDTGQLHAQYIGLMVQPSSV